MQRASLFGLFPYLHYSTMHLSWVSKCTIRNRNMHISFLNSTLWDNGQVHCGIREISLLIRQGIHQKCTHAQDVDKYIVGFSYFIDVYTQPQLHQHPQIR